MLAHVTPASLLLEDFHRDVLDQLELPDAVLTTDYCQRAKTEAFTTEALRPLTRSENLGCRNPIGLDHVLVSQALSDGAAAEKVALGRFGGTRPATDRFPEPLLAVSDHCPVKVKLSF
jgi:hypothetical protein